MSKRITQAEFARICGVNRSTVSKWVKAGRIHLGSDKRLDKDAALQMREITESHAPHHQARKAQIEADKKEPLHEPSADQNEAKRIAIKLKIATMREREAKAAMAEMDRQKQAGQLIDREDVDYVLKDLGHTLRALMESLPDRLSSELAGYRGDVNAIHSALDNAGRELLEEISTHMARKKEGVLHG